jgi:glycosyltransferase involved in cell wall biosynthesis
MKCNNMWVLSIGMDRAMFTAGSAVEKRTLEYGAAVDELHIVVFSHVRHELRNKELAENVFLYPTNSRHKLLYIIDAILIGRRLLNAAESSRRIITTQDPAETGVVGWVLAHLSGAPLHMQIHVDIFSSFFARGHRGNRLRQWIAVLVLRKASRIRAVSKRIKCSLARMFGDDIKNSIDVLPIFVDVTAFEKVKARVKEVQADQNIVIVSRLEPEKNVALALYTLADVLPDYPRAKLIIAGEGGEQGRLEALATQLHVSEQVRFIGWVDDLPALYESADVYLQTSDYEGYGMTLLEAAAAGRAVVTTDVGLVGEVLTPGKSTLSCAVGDRACLSSHVRACLGQEEQALTLGKHARRAAKSLDTKTNAEYNAKYIESWRATLPA